MFHNVTGEQKYISISEHEKEAAEWKVHISPVTIGYAKFGYDNAHKDKFASTAIFSDMIFPEDKKWHNLTL